MRKINLITALCVVLLLSMGMVYGADSRANPVTAVYCGGGALDVYPYSFVTRSDGSTFNCYEVQVAPIADGLRYGFEDADDADYNDVVIEVWISGNNTSSPVAHVKYVSKEAAYLHWIHVVYGGADVLVFKAEEASPGAVFDVPLPVHECPDFVIKASPAEQTVTPGEATQFTVDLTALNGFNAAVDLSVSGIPAGASGSFTVNPVNPAVGGASILKITTTSAVQPGAYPLTITGAGGGQTHSAGVSLKVMCPDFEVKIKAEPMSGPAPLTVQFSAVISGSLSYSFSWDFGDGSTSNEQNPVHTYQAPGNYTAALTVTDPCGTSKTANIIIQATGFEGIITTSFSTDQAAPGDVVFINIRAENTTHYDFNSISIRDELSPLLEYLEDTAPVRHRRSGQEFFWQFPVLKEGAAISFQIKVKISDAAPAGTITNKAFLTHESLGVGKWIPSNVASLMVNPVSVTLEKWVNTGSARPGDTLNYRLTLKNNSAAALQNIKLGDELSSYLEFISAAPAASFRFSRAGQVLTWEGSVEGRSQAIAVFSARIKSDTRGGTRIQNNALLSGGGLKASVTSNTVVTTVSAEPISPTKIRFTQRPEVPQTEIGRVVTFSITLTNLSRSDLMSPIIEDYLPQGFNYTEQTSLLNNQRFAEPQGNRRLLWQLPAVKGNETITLRYQVIIGADAARGKNIVRAVLHAVDNSGQDIYAEAPAFVNVSTAGLIFFCGVQGTVFLDRDDDDFFSGEDTPLQGIEICLSTGQKTTSDAFGQYNFENLFPGEYALGINRAVLPDKYKISSQSPAPVVLSDGLSDYVDFALQFKNEDKPGEARLEGRVFFDKNQDQVYDAGDVLCMDFKANLDNRDVISSGNGTYVFTLLEPGSHALEIVYDNGAKSIKKEFSIVKGNNRIDVPLRYTGIKIIVKSEK